MAPEKGGRKELSQNEKFVIKQSATRISQIAGDYITAVGVKNLLNPQNKVTTVVTGRYVPQTTITVNEMRLSESRRKSDLRRSKERHVRYKVEGKPGKGKRYQSSTSYVRADRTARGKIIVTSKGRDFLHSIETQPERDKRLARSRNKARATVIGGRSLRYGVPALMVGWTIYDVFSGNAETGTPEENLIYGLGGWALKDTKMIGKIAAQGKTTNTLTGGNLDLKKVFS